MKNINNNVAIPPGKKEAFKHIVRRSIKKKTAVKASDTMHFDANTPIPKNVFYIGTTPFDMQYRLNKRKDIMGIVYEESGSRFRANLYTLPHNTTIRFFYKKDRNGNPHTVFSRKWNKNKNCIDRCD